MGTSRRNPAALMILIAIIVLSGWGQGGLPAWVILAVTLLCSASGIWLQSFAPARGLGKLLFVPLLLFAILQGMAFLPVSWPGTSAYPAADSSLRNGFAAQQALQGKSFDDVIQNTLAGQDLFASGELPAETRLANNSFASRAMASTLLLLAALLVMERLLKAIGRTLSGQVLFFLALGVLAMMLWLRLDLVQAGEPLLWGPFNSNHRSLVILLTMPHLLAPFCGRWTRKTSASEKAGLFLCICATLGVGAMLVAQESSRGSLVAMVVGGGLLLWSVFIHLVPRTDGDMPQSGKKFLVWISVPMLAVLPAFLLVPRILVNMHQSKTFAYGYNLALFKLFPATGVGPGQWPIFSPLVENLHSEKTLYYGESSGLQILAENGLPGGLMALAASLILICTWAMASRRVSQRRLRRALPFLAFVPALALSGVAEFGFTLPFSLILFSLYLTRGSQLLGLLRGEGPARLQTGLLGVCGVVLLLLFFKAGPERPNVNNLTPWFRAQALGAIHESPDNPEHALQLCERYRLWGLRTQLAGWYWARSSLALAEGQEQEGIGYAIWSGRFHPQPVGFRTLVTRAYGDPFFGGLDQKILAGLVPHDLLLVPGKYTGFARRTFSARLKSEQSELAGAPGTKGVFRVHAEYQNKPDKGWADYRFPVMSLIPQNTPVWVRMRGTWDPEGDPPKGRLFGAVFASGQNGNVIPLARNPGELAGEWIFGPFVSPGNGEAFLLEGVHLDLLPCGENVEVTLLEVWYGQPGWQKE